MTFRALIVAVASVVIVSRSSSQDAAFAVDLTPSVSEGIIGDVVSFDVHPHVEPGTEWQLSSGGYARLRDIDEFLSPFWRAGDEPIRMELLVAPPSDDDWLAEATWLSAVRRGESDADWMHVRDRIPVRVLPYRELGAVSVSAEFYEDSDLSLADLYGKSRGDIVVEPASISSRRTGSQIEVEYVGGLRLSTEAPGIDVVPMLVESSGAKVLFVRMMMSYSDVKEVVGRFEVRMRYDTDIGGPVHVVVANWESHGWATHPFELVRGIVR